MRRYICVKFLEVTSERTIHFCIIFLLCHVLKKTHPVIKPSAAVSNSHHLEYTILNPLHPKERHLPVELPIQTAKS